MTAQGARDAIFNLRLLETTYRTSAKALRARQDADSIAVGIEATERPLVILEEEEKAEQEGMA